MHPEDLFSVFLRNVSLVYDSDSTNTGGKKGFKIHEIYLTAQCALIWT